MPFSPVSASLAWLLNRRVSQPLARLTAAASQISDGKLDTPIEMPATGHPHDEIGELAASLIEMHARLRADRDLLDRERSFLKTLIDSLPDLVWLKNPEGIYLACNPPFEDFFGAPEKDSRHVSPPMVVVVESGVTAKVMP